MSWQEPMESQEKKWSFSLKNWDKQQWLILLLLGLILLVAAMPVKNQVHQTTSKNTAAEQETTNSGHEALTEKAALEQQLEELLQQVEGIGKVKVMLMLADSSDSLTSFSSPGTSITIEGVLIVAQGGDNSVVVRNIQEAVMALFQVKAHKIKIIKMK